MSKTILYFQDILRTVEQLALNQMSPEKYISIFAPNSDAYLTFRSENLKNRVFWKIVVSL